MDIQYNECLEHILAQGEKREDRTGVGTIGVFGYQMRFDLRQGFPAQTTKKLAWKSVVGELLWFIEGSCDDKRLAELTYGDPTRKTIWTANAKAPAWQEKARFKGDVGRIYGVQWREWARLPWESGIDQLQNLLDELRDNPYSRRHIISSWNPSDLGKMCLPPCHVLAQFHVNNDNELSCQLYQRSCDMFLGVPFNIASYSLLTHMIARELDMKVGEFIWTGGDCHIYLNHIDQVKEVLEREPYELPTLEINEKVKSMFDLTVDDCTLRNYKYHPPIKADMAV